MSGIRWRGPLAGVVVSVIGAFACQATYNKRTGELNISFAPDMTIRAFGLEDALSKLSDLMSQCIAGSFHRPCSQAEMDEINEAIDNVLDAKGRVRPPEGIGELDM